MILIFEISVLDHYFADNPLQLNMPSTSLSPAGTSKRNVGPETSNSGYGSGNRTGGWTSSFMSPEKWWKENVALFWNGEWDYALLMWVMPLLHLCNYSNSELGVTNTFLYLHLWLEEKCNALYVYSLKCVDKKAFAEAFVLHTQGMKCMFAIIQDFPQPLYNSFTGCVILLCDPYISFFLATLVLCD